MLRKRTSFKPNLKQVATPQSDTKKSAPTISSANEEAKRQEENVTNITKDVSEPEPPSPTASQIPEVSNQRVQEAITQLTGHKFEPIKLLSLRSSANKNVKLKDLLFYNPPMTKDQKRHKKSVVQAKKNEQKKNYNKETEAQQSQESTVEEHSLIPKVKMGPGGQLVLDESSMIINRKNAIKEQEAIIEDNEDIISRTNYDSFRRRPSNTSQTKWSLDDTRKFYQALTILGTDFSMMESLLFSGLRSRTELHKKFKREERVNKIKVDIALSNRISLNSEELEDLKEIFHSDLAPHLLRHTTSSRSCCACSTDLPLVTK